jgi:formate hydrogenlyase subunit 4
MTFVAGLFAQVLHIALIGVAAPTLAGMLRWIEARLEGRTGPSPLQPWQDLMRLVRKETVLAESASAVTGFAPASAAAATAVAAALVPSFALGMTLAPLADLLVIAGLLLAARCALALAAMDAGTAGGGMGASRAMLLAGLSEPPLLLVLVVLGLFAGSLDVDLIAAMQMETPGRWRAALGLALIATLLVGLLETERRDALAQDFSGPDLALIEASEALRLVVWFNLIGAVFLPFGIAPSGAGPIGWAIGLIAWVGRTLVLAALLAVVQTLLGRMALPRAARAAGIATLLGLLAALFVFAGARTA